MVARERVTDVGLSPPPPPDPALVDQMRAAAKAVSDNAYAPYSRFQVGAAVLSGDGKIFSGCNVENASYGLTICAERNAVFQAVAAGSSSIAGVVIVAGSGVPAPPCGACRQVIREFGRDSWIVGFSRDGQRRDWTLAELLPLAFGPEDLLPSDSDPSAGAVSRPNSPRKRTTAQV